MAARLSTLAKACSLALVLFIAPVQSQPLSAPAPQQVDIEEALTRLPPEVRIRKLHLVRPDLIPYPIAYETYC